MKIKNNIKRLLCIALCISLMVGMIVLATSCGDNAKETEGPAGTEVKTGVPVVVVLNDIKKGEILTTDNIGIEYVPEDDIPLNAVLATLTDSEPIIPEKIIGEYANVALYKNEFIFRAKLSSEKILGGGLAVNYILVSDYIKSGDDASTVIQKLIDENPGRTLYFKDATYELSTPLVVPTDTGKTVGFELSKYAVLKASSSWSSTDAMIRFVANDDGMGGGTFEGGVIDGNGKAKGIAIEGGKNVYILNSSIRNITTGLSIADFSATALIKDINIAGASADSSTGVLVNGSGSYMSEINIFNTKIAVDVDGELNRFTNVIAEYSGSSADAYGFYDHSTSGDNIFQMCKTNNYPIGFMLSESCNSLFLECCTDWSSATAKQWAFKVDGKLNAKEIRACKAEFTSASSDNAYLKASSGGSGKILMPIIVGSDLLDSQEHSSYIEGTSTVYK